MSLKPKIFVCNVDEASVQNGNKYTQAFVDKFGEKNKPTVDAYDVRSVMVDDSGVLGGVEAPGIDANGNPYLRILKATAGVPNTDFPEAPEVVRFMQTGGNAATWTEFFGTQDIAVKSVIEDPNSATHWRVTLDYDMGTDAIPLSNLGTEDPVTVLAKPSQSIVAYFESTEGLVEGVKDASYSNKIVVQEIGASATRLAAGAATNNEGALAWVQENGTTMGTYNTRANNSLRAFGLQADGVVGSANNAAPVVTTNWVDDRNPPIKIGYDEKEQRLTFDGDNSLLGLGTGIGMQSFTAYSAALDAGQSDLGIPSFGNNRDISLETDDLLLGNSFVNDGPDVMVTNKRYGMEVNFDTVGSKFDIKSGKTGEQLAENSAVGVTDNQSASDVAVGRRNLTLTGLVDPVDREVYSAHKIGAGTAIIMGFPREGDQGFAAPTGLASQPCRCHWI